MQEPQCSTTVTENRKGRRMPPFLLLLIKLGKTLASIAATMLGLLFVTFFIGRVMPRDPVLSIVGERATKEIYDAAYIKLGLDKPLIIQFFIYVSDVVQGDFGQSLRTVFPVST